MILVFLFFKEHFHHIYNIKVLLKDDKIRIPQMENHYKNNQSSRMKFPLIAGLIGMAMCGDNDIKGPGNVVISGKDNQIDGKQNTVDGWNNKVNGDFNDIQGDKNDVSGDKNLVDGNGNLVIGSGNIVMGQGNFVNDDMNVNIDMNLGKYLQSQQPFPEMPPNPLLGGMNMAMMMNPNMMGPQFQQAMMEKMRMEMQMRFSQMRGNHAVRNHKTHVFGHPKKEI